MKSIVTFLACACMATTVFATTYRNQNESMLVLTKTNKTPNTGTLTGSFTTAVGDCKPDMNRPMPITGVFNAQTIAIAINFPDCGQVIAMTGQVDSTGDTLNTTWLDTNTKAGAWNSNLVGSDHYVKVD